MQMLIHTIIGENRGSNRIWLEQEVLSILSEIGNLISLSFSNNTLYGVVSNDGNVLISKRKVKGQNRYKPLIELRDSHCIESLGKTLAELFPLSRKLRVVVKKGVVAIKTALIDLKKLFSINTTKQKVSENKTLSIASFFTGGAILDRGIHRGFAKRGLKTKVELAVERDHRYLDAAITNQPELFSDDCSLCVSDTRDLFFQKFHKHIDMFVAGIPCTASSPAGRSKKKLQFPEACKDAGSAFVDVLTFININMPTLVLIENERSYKGTASFAVICNKLEYLGYKITYQVLDSSEYGSFEPRKRVFLIATLFDDFSFNFSNLPKSSNIRTIESICDDVPLDSEKYRTYSYLKEKEIKDKESGKGFSRSLHNGSETVLKNIIRRLYAKSGSCDPFLQHPLHPELSRLFTANEHARLRDVDTTVIRGLNETLAHQILGQSGSYLVFELLAIELANAINDKAA